MFSKKITNMLAVSTFPFSALSKELARCFSKGRRRHLARTEESLVVLVGDCGPKLFTAHDGIRFPIVAVLAGLPTRRLSIMLVIFFSLVVFGVTFPPTTQYTEISKSSGMKIDERAC